jgi:hypothetical protein
MGIELNEQTPRHKALHINLDTRTYGTFAEIGAGQEVAALFFKAGAASGTIAKTMSAYDMTFSDAIYGKEESGRYVCESRLNKMLNKEYSLLEERLKAVRPPDTLFFAMANTVVCLNFKKTNQGHGWLGVRFQLEPNSPPNDLIVHVRMLDTDSALQQQAIGILGVNMVYACFYYNETPEQMMISLMDNLGPERIEIDMFKLSGPSFINVDNRLMALKLVKNGLTNAALFSPNGDVLQPSEVLYKKNILVTRGRFRPLTKINQDMFEKSFEQFKNDKSVQGEPIIELAELTLANLRGGNDEINEKDFLDIIDILCSEGKNVLLSNYHEYYRLVTYLSQHTKLKIGIVLGMPSLSQIFNEEFYVNLKGGILESFAQLFSRNVKLYIYPALNKDNSPIISGREYQLPPNLIDLYEYLWVNDKIEDIQNPNIDNPGIYSDEVLKMIHDKNPEWEKHVPAHVAETIKEKHLFMY